MDSKGTIWRAIATIAVWFMVVAAIALTSIFLAKEIGSDALGAVFMVLVAAIITNGFIWDWGRGGQASRRDLRKRQEIEADLYNMALSGAQKRKRDEIGSRLGDFSDAELVALRERLQRGEIDEEELAYLLRQ